MKDQGRKSTDGLDEVASWLRFGEGVAAQPVRCPCHNATCLGLAFGYLPSIEASQIGHDVELLPEKDSNSELG